MNRWLHTLLLAIIAGVLCPGVQCGGDGEGPAVQLTLNAVPDDLNDLMVVPPSGFVVNATFIEGIDPIVPSSAAVQVVQWGTETVTDLASELSTDASGVTGIVTTPLPPGSYTLAVSVEDDEGRIGAGVLDFSVRDFVTTLPPIGTGQVIWYDFTADRDGDYEEDFAADLRFFGLASETDPYGLAPQIEATVVGRLLARVESAYYDQDPAGLGAPDPVDVTFVTHDPGAGDVTRICVGGEAPGQPDLIGSILIDRNNVSKSSVECSTIPPTGVFARGLQAYSNGSAFIEVFGAVMPGLGGTPAGDDPLDPIVLAPSFDPSAASQPEIDRYQELQAAFDAFANALGTVVAHETGHALGLVEPGPPGGGLYGGTSGANYSHNVQADGVTPPAEPWLMNAGNTLSFAKLAGLGQPLPVFRPLSHAYLRDRVVQDPAVTAILDPPIVESADPTYVENSIETLTVTGQHFQSPPTIRLQGIDVSYTYDLIGETWVSENEVTGLILDVQLPPGSYWVEVTNPDGQVSPPSMAYVVNL